MEKKVIVITGASDGIGLETAIQLANMGYVIVMIVRNPDKGELVRQDIKSASQNQDIFLYTADLSDPDQIRKAAVQLKKDFPKIHVLINNAGVFQKKREETIQGYEMTFAVNHLSYFLLTNLLLSSLYAARPSRIINVSSMAHQGAEMDFDDIHIKKKYDGFQAYARSKLANLLFTYALHRRLFHKGITINALHPGVINTKLLRAGWGSLSGSAGQTGAETSVYLASSPAVEGVSGNYFVDSAIARSSLESHDKEAAERLWTLSEQMTEVFDLTVVQG